MSDLAIDKSSDPARWSLGTCTTWQTEDEIQFLIHLADHFPDRLALYAPIVLEDRRRWDKSVDVERVKRMVRNCLAGYGVAVEGVA